MTTPPITTSIRRSDGAVFEGQELPVEAPRTCQKCGTRKVLHKCGAGNLVWRCRPCHNAYNKMRRAQVKAASSKPALAPEQTEIKPPKPKKYRSPLYGSIHEYWACERRWAQTPASPSKASGGHTNKGPNPFPQCPVGGKG